MDSKVAVAPDVLPEPESELGALIDKVQFDKVLGYIQAGKDEGARIATGGERIGTKVGGPPTLLSSC